MLSNIRICNLAAATPDQLAQTAAMLYLAFRATNTSSWATKAQRGGATACAAEPVRINRLVMQPDGRGVGWIGAIPEGYSAAWELHPLVVHSAYQRMGIGHQLLADLLVHVREQGALTLWFGTNNANQRTSIGGIDRLQTRLCGSGGDPRCEWARQAKSAACASRSGIGRVYAIL